MTDERPKLMQELVYDGLLPESAQPTILSYGHPCFFPHCDSRILHTPEQCTTCAKFDALQQERAEKDVSNTGTLNRRWICPADVARPPEQYNAWYGNTRKHGIE